VIGSRFEASYTFADADADAPALGSGQGAPRIIPTLRGSAHVCAEATLLISDSDPFAWGIRAS